MNWIHSIVTALPFENVVSVEGNVFNPGLVALKRAYNSKVYQAGYKPYSMKEVHMLEKPTKFIKQIYFLAEPS